MHLSLRHRTAVALTAAYAAGVRATVDVLEAWWRCKVETGEEARLAQVVTRVTRQWINVEQVNQSMELTGLAWQEAR